MSAHIKLSLTPSEYALLHQLCPADMEFAVWVRGELLRLAKLHGWPWAELRN